MFGLGPVELIIILAILLLLFGSTKLPKLAKSIGQSAGELQKGFEDTRKSSTKQEENKSSSET